jgi:hypothetical protein
LTDDDRPRAEDEYFGDVSSFRHLVSFIFWLLNLRS